MQITITGIRYQFSPSLTHEERTKMAEELVRNIKRGTELILKAEPDNVKDMKAVAVYMDWVQKIGYVSSEEVDYVHSLLDSTGEADAVVSSNDGHVTMFAEIKNSPHIDSIPTRQERNIPAPPFDSSVFLPFTDDARSLDIVSKRLKDCKVCAENTDMLFLLIELIKPRIQKSWCTEDMAIIRNTHNKIKDMESQLQLDDAQTEKLKELRQFFKKAVRNLKVEDKRKSIFLQLYDQLKANAKDSLNEKYDNFYLHGALNTASAETIQSEHERLNEWLLNIPNGAFRGKTEDLASSLHYLHLTRRELYDIISVMITRERLAEQMGIVSAEVAEKKLEEEEFIKLLADSCFYGIEKNAREFLISIKGLKPVEITKKVNELVRKNEISDRSCHRTMHAILKDQGLYNRTESNWNNQIKAQNPKR